MMKKRLLSWLIVCCMIMAIMPMTIQAAQNEQISPRWTNVNRVNAYITFNGTTGNVIVSVVGKTGVTNISLDIKLYYKSTSGSWIEIDKDWDYNVNQISLTVNESFDAVAGREYKIEVNGTATKGGYAEPISKTVTAVCP